MKKITTLSLTFWMFAALMLVTSKAHAIPLQWTMASGGNNHYYEVITGAFSWTSAFADARTRSHLGEAGYLATILSSSENSFITSNFTGGYAWFGANDIASEGDFVWSDGPETGDSLSFFNWDPPNPDNFPHTAAGEDWVAINLTTGQWADAPENASNVAAYVVEYNGLPDSIDTNAVPEPASMILFGSGLAGAFLRKKFVG